MDWLLCLHAEGSDAGLSVVAIVNFIIAVIGFGFSIYNFVTGLVKSSADNKRLTIEEYHRIADEGCPLHWFYHMTDLELNDIKYLLTIDHDILREKRDPRIIELEDNLGKLDEFASAIYKRLYHYRIFKKLAINYCRKRVTPHLIDILSLYKSHSYRSIRWLTYKMQRDNISYYMKHKKATEKELKTKEIELQKAKNYKDVEKVGDIEKNIGLLKDSVKKDREQIAKKTEIKECYKKARKMCRAF